MIPEAPRRGRFITLEGVEGVGKSTNLEFMRQFLVSLGVPVLQTREPGGTAMAEEIRALLLARRVETVDSRTELLLMYAARAQHITRVILPALAAGQWVLCDRFSDATYAYQGGGRGIHYADIDRLDHWVVGDLKPDRTFYLDVAVEIGLSRVQERSAVDRIESEAKNFFELVRSAYQLRIAADPSRFVVVDAAQSLDTVQQSLAASLVVEVDAWRCVTNTDVLLC